LWSDLIFVEFVGGGTAPEASSIADASDDPPSIDTPKRRRSSRSRTKSPEPIISKAQDPALSSVVEEPEEAAQENTPVKALEQQQAHPDSQMYEKIIDEMEVDESNAQDVNEDELLAEPEDLASQESDKKEAQNLPEGEPQAENKAETEGKPQTDDENRGTKRRSDSPTKGNTPKKRQRLPPPNIEDFVNDEDEPELDETTLQLSWCKF
jgi:hypothetical protein